MADLKGTLLPLVEMAMDMALLWIYSSQDEITVTCDLIYPYFGVLEEIQALNM